MADRGILLAKSVAVKKHMGRIAEKRNIDLATFLEDIDCQESILFNLQMAIQNCIDLAAHIVSDDELGLPGSTNELFYLLEENGYLSRELAEKMIKAVGFRNLIVHEYVKIDLKQVYDIAQEDMKDLDVFLRALFEKLGVEQ
jgi:uncharacterized protein YutE (UPF0331/DUF86 family)